METDLMLEISMNKMSKKSNPRKRSSGKMSKKLFGPFLDLCISSLRRDQANLLCVIPILSDVPEETNLAIRVLVDKQKKTFFYS